MYTFCPPGSDIDIIQLSFANCINDLISWFSYHSLSLNITKTYIAFYFLDLFLQLLSLIHFLSHFLSQTPSLL